MKILVVDDIPDNVELVSQTLEDFDYDVITAENGRRAIDKSISEQPDLVLLDIMMPDIDGYEVCELLTSNKVTSDIPIIMLTAKTEPEDLKKGFDVGAHDYIEKPFEEIELITRVKSALKLKESRNELKKKNEELSSLAQELKASNELLFKDIEERKELEQELKLNNEYLANLIRDSPVAIISTDLNGDIVTANTSAKRLLGITEDEIIGVSISRILGRQTEITDVNDIQLKIAKKDGTKIPVSVSTAVLKEMGEEKGLIITIKDISGLKGLIIQPVEEEEEIKEDMKFELDRGLCHFLDNDDYSRGFDIFIDYVKHRRHGLCISRQSPIKVRTKYKLERTPIIWLTKAETSEEKCISPDDLTKLDSTIKNFVKEAEDGIVLLEGLEYLCIHNNFNSVIKFINSLTDALALSSSRLIVLVDSKAFEDKDFHILKRDLEPIPNEPLEDGVIIDGPKS
ncbi:MAG: DUF835 domain-containing protein [Halobacteriota archaeon]|nr:DUF835 domain-containing protein [Halobacteriota archaeon]